MVFLLVNGASEKY